MVCIDLLVAARFSLLAARLERLRTAYRKFSRKGGVWDERRLERDGSKEKRPEATSTRAL